MRLHVSPRRWLPVAFSMVVSACASAPPPTPAAVAINVPPAAPSPPPPADAPVAIPSEDDAAVPVVSTDPTWGSRTAPVTLVFFGDFQCPFTARAVKTMHALQEKYGPSALRIVWKNDPLPFHPNALPAAQAAEAVHLLGGDAFWQFHAQAFDDQAQLSEASYEAWAQAAGIDPARLRETASGNAVAAKLDADLALVKRLGVDGTPGFFVNGVAIHGAQPLDTFVEVIDAEASKAQTRLAAGTSPGELYAAMAKDNYQAHRAAPEPPRERADTTTVFKVPIAGAPTLGSDTAAVTIVEFGDYQCPFSKRVLPVLEQIRSSYGDKVRLVWRDEPLPFHPRARAAAELARAARAQKGLTGFWAVHDALFASQPRLEDGDLTGIAAAAGLDVTQAMDAVKHARFEAGIGDDEAVSDDLQATGTPHFFINGRRLVGAQPFEAFQTIIDQEIGRAAGVRAKLAPGANLYDALVKDGKRPPPPETRKVRDPARGAPVRGSAAAKVTIQEFADFQCPFCKRAEDTIRKLVDQSGGQAKLVWRDLPLPMHPSAELAAEAAREAQRQKGNDGFWKMHDRLFAGQTTPGLDRSALAGYARELGLDLAAFDAALDRSAARATIDADRDAAHDAGITGTPAFIIGGYFVNGAQPEHVFRRVIARVLESGPATVFTPPPATTTARAFPAPPSASPAVVPGSQDLVVGTGAIAKAGDTLTVHYVGTLSDGTVFDSSRARAKPFTFLLGAGQVIKGWDLGVAGMHVGGVRRLVIPPSLAYGDAGRPSIPGGSTLTFEVELLAIQ